VRQALSRASISFSDPLLYALNLIRRPESPISSSTLRLKVSWQNAKLLPFTQRTHATIQNLGGLADVDPAAPIVVFVHQ
jgi:hypothetical protein